MSSDLCNAAQISQRFMNDVLRGLDFFCAYLNDIFVFSRNLLDRIQRYEVVINSAKCVFRAPEIIFHGYKVSVDGFQLLEERMTHLQNRQPPENHQPLGPFLVILNFYM
jgi:hypothetical protein